MRDGIKGTGKFHKLVYRGDVGGGEWVTICGVENTISTNLAQYWENVNCKNCLRGRKK